jgi:hypothetical protein
VRHQLGLILAGGSRDAEGAQLAADPCEAFEQLVEGVRRRFVVERPTRLGEAAEIRTIGVARAGP